MFPLYLHFEDSWTKGPQLSPVMVQMDIMCLPLKCTENTTVVFLIEMHNQNLIMRKYQKN